MATYGVARQQQLQRLIVLMLALCALVILIVCRLIHIQLLSGDTYKKLAEQNRLFAVSVAQSRAVFFDRYAMPLVVNAPQYALIDDSKALYTHKTPVSREEALQALATNSAVVTYSFVRQYFYPTSLSHLLGYVGTVSREELQQRDDLGFQDFVGKSGMEKAFDRQVRGTPSKQVYEINALGRRQRLIEEEPGTFGSSITLAIDPILNEVAKAALKGQTGAVVIMDAHTGHVLSILSYPDYDANLLEPIIDDDAAEISRRAQVQNWLLDERLVFFNRAVSGEYPPGSVFKIMTALAGLDSGAIDEQTKVLDEGVLKVGEYTYRNWLYRQNGGVDGQIGVRRAIARSNDIYFYKAAEWTGPTKIASMARLFGFGLPTGIEIANEGDGLVPDPVWKEETIGERWFLGNTYHFGIGQGDTLVTPLQVAQMTQAVANRGSLCRASILEKAADCSENGIKEEYLDLVTHGMIDACSAGGTAGQFFARNEQISQEIQQNLGSENNDSYAEIKRGKVACKTGTAEFGGVDQKGRRRTHGWFTAIAGIRKDQMIAPPLLLPPASAATASSSIDTATTSAVFEPIAEDHLQHEILTTLKAETVDYQRLHNLWLQLQARNNFPDQLVFSVLVESSEDVPFREGSSHSAPIVKKILDWVETGKNPTEMPILPVQVPGD